MKKFEERLRELGIVLPSLPAPIANYVPAKRVGNLIFTAGQVSVANGREYKGKLGDNLSLDDARAATKACIINCLSAIKSVAGALDNIKQVVAVHGLVNSTSDCEDQAKAMNGASDFVVDVFGEVGKHTRTAVGVASLPMGFAASVYMIVEVE
ncbi:MAG: RidA family protein [Candidatus Brocadiia bacterium]|nr:MAG: RidA family protein [Candidatus Brocadiia bacterium]